MVRVVHVPLFLGDVDSIEGFSVLSPDRALAAVTRRIKNDGWGQRFARIHVSLMHRRHKWDRIGFGMYRCNGRFWL